MSPGLARRLLRTCYQPLLGGGGLVLIGHFCPALMWFCDACIFAFTAFILGRIWEQRRADKIIDAMHADELERMEKLAALLRWKLHGESSPFSIEFEGAFEQFKNDTNRELN